MLFKNNIKNIATLSCLLLSACGTIGIGSNDVVDIYNHSNDTIHVSGSSGIAKIRPNTSVKIPSKGNLQINSTNNMCNSAIVETETNGVAIALDIIPGLTFGFIPLLIDAITGSFSTMPDSYTYQCM